MVDTSDSKKGERVLPRPNRRQPSCLDEAPQFVSLAGVIQELRRMMPMAEIRVGCRRGFLAYMRIYICRDIPYTTVAIDGHRDYLLSRDATVFILDHCPPSFALLAIKKMVLAGNSNITAEPENLTPEMDSLIRYIVHGAAPDETTEVDVAAAAISAFNMAVTCVPDKLRQASRGAAIVALNHLTGQSSG